MTGVLYSFDLQFVSHPLLYKRLQIRWTQGLPEVLRRWTLLLWLVVIIDAALTPLLVAFVGLAFYRDQKKVKRYFLHIRRNPDFSKLPIFVLILLLIYIRFLEHSTFRNQEKLLF